MKKYHKIIYWEMARDLGVAIGVTLLLLLLISLFALPLIAYNCNKIGENVDKHTEYHLIGGGCLIDVDGEIIPVDQWRNNTGN